MYSVSPKSRFPAVSQLHAVDDSPRRATGRESISRKATSAATNDAATDTVAISAAARRGTAVPRRVIRTALASVVVGFGFRFGFVLAGRRCFGFAPVAW